MSDSQISESRKLFSFSTHVTTVNTTTDATEHLNDDPVGFLSCFVSVPELINEEVAALISSHLD